MLACKKLISGLDIIDFFDKKSIYRIGHAFWLNFELNYQITSNFLFKILLKENACNKTSLFQS